MSQYNWNWWFVLSVIGLLVGMMGIMVGEHIFSTRIVVVSSISSIGCLYVGMKPEED